MNQRSKRFLSILLSLVMLLSLMPGMGLTAYAAPTETLLTTITATGKEQASYSTANVATVSFSYTAYGSSAYHANWGWWGYGWTATVNAAEGYTITKCVFYDDQNRTATDSEASFVVETTEEDKTPKVNGTPILADTSKGIKKIEVYGYATPTHTHSFTYSASGATITATCAAGCDITEGLTLTISAPTGDLTADGTKTFPATLSTGYNTTAFPDTYTISYTKDGQPYSGDFTDAGAYVASVTVGDATASVSYTVTAPTVAVTSISLDKNSATLTVGGTETLTATVAPDDATDKTVKWSTTGGVTLYSDENCTAGNEIGADATSTLTVYAKGISAGSATVTVTSNADANKSASCDVTVNKANPTAPTGLTATYGQTLADVTLPTGWTWVDSTQSVGSVVSPAATFKANFAGNDNYNAASNVDVAVTVSKAANPAAVTSTATVTKGGNTVDLASNVTLNDATGEVTYAIDGEANGCSLNGSVLTSGDNTGSVTVNVSVAADDNYEALATVPITVTISDSAVPSKGYFADLVPTGSEDADALAAKQVTFNEKKWYVINDVSTAANAGTLTLLYAGSLGNYPFDKDGSNNYANSSIKRALDGLTAESGYYYPVADAINGKLYLLSVEEAEQVPQNVRADFSYDAWWLRDERPDGKVAYVFVNDTVQNKPGRIPESGVSPTVSVGVRPALQLDLSKVVYDAASKTYYIPVTAPTDVTVTGATLAAGYGTGSVSVTATAAGGHTLSYQWYQNTANSNEGGTLIENATSATYDIPTGKTAGDYYYYCVVTATRTDNGQTASVTSGVATVTVAADTDALVEKLAEENNIDLSQYYRIPAEDMYFTSNEYWNKNSSWEKLPDEAGHVATKQFTKQGLPEDSVIFCKAYYAFEAVAWASSSSTTGNSAEIGKRYSVLTKISDQFTLWNDYSFFGFNLTKYAEGGFTTKETVDLSNISDAFRIYVPKPADAAEVNGTAYPTVADAIRAAGAGDTVKLLRNVTENVVLTSGQNITLDLNGHKLTNDGRHCTIVAQNGSTLVVIGNGTVDNTTHGCAPLYNNGGTVTLSGGTFKRSQENGNGNGNTYYTVVNRGTMTINEGVTVSNDDYHYSSLIANGYSGLTKTGYREIDPKISNGYVPGESAANPTLTINGGTFTGGNQALKNDVNGVATINGGSFSSTAGHAIKNLSELTINGGTFTANAEGKFALYSTTESGIATVTGGTFNGKLQKDEGATIAISGGEFSEIVPEDCCAEGYQPATTANSNGKYIVTHSLDSNNLHSADEVAGMIANKTAPVNNDPETMATDGLFLGWYADEACTQPITDASQIPEGGAYAKFIPTNSLGLAVQFRVPAKSGQADRTDLRLVATVPDISLYQAVGYKVEAYRDDDWKMLLDKSYSDMIYNNYITVTTDGVTTNFTLADALNAGIGNEEWSKYITGVILLNMPNDYLAGDGTLFKVTQYIVTKDGTKSAIGEKPFVIKTVDGKPTALPAEES